MSRISANDVVRPTFEPVEMMMTTTTTMRSKPAQQGVAKV